MLKYERKKKIKIIVIDMEKIVVINLVIKIIYKSL
jgi:hypothetical protein